MPPQITIPVTWIEGLLEYAKRVDGQIKLLGQEQKMSFLGIEVDSLLGYISSAESFIKVKE